MSEFETDITPTNINLPPYLTVQQVHSASPTVSVPRKPVCNYDLEQQRIQKLEAENYRMKQILAAAEQLYEAACEAIDCIEYYCKNMPIDRSEWKQALADYANAKGK